MVVLGHGTLALEDLDGDRVLVVGGSRKNLRLLRWDDRVAGDQLGHDTSDRFNAHRQRVHVKEDDLACVLLATEHAGLDSSAVGDGLIGVDTAARLLAVEELLDQLLHFGDARRAADQDNLIDLGLLHVGVFEDFLDRLHGRAEQVHVQFFELGAGQRLGEVFALEEALNFDPDLMGRGKSALGLFNLTTQLLDGAVVFTDVLALLFLVQLDEVIHDALVKVFASQVGITVGRNHLKDTVVDRQQRNVEGAATQVEDQNVLLALLLVKTVGDGSSRRLVDDAHHVQTCKINQVTYCRTCPTPSECLRTGNHSGILRCLALGVIKVSRDSDNSMSHLLAQVSFSNLLHLGQDHSRDLFRSKGSLSLRCLHFNVRFAALFNNLKEESFNFGIQSDGFK